MGKNDITGDSIITKSSETYRNNYNSIFRKEEPKKENQIASWSISLDTECPKCGEDFDILNTEPDFWLDTKLEPLEHDTKKSKDYKVICPECGHKFPVDFTY
jgi:predicted RNA-binding Zn-ribbon protein involved in translation (DUF1610 family)